MTEKDIEHFKNALLSEKKLLEQEMNDVGVKNPTADEGSTADWIAKPDDMDILGADENEVADEMESFQNNQAILGSLETRYREVTAALERIEQGTYGICKVTGKEIERERLEANPAADTSIAHREE